MAGNTGSIKVVDNQQVAATGTVYSSVNGSAWIEVPSGFAFTLWYWVDSTGTQDVNIFLDVSPYSIGSLTSTTTDAKLYTTETVVDAFSTKATLTRYGSSTVLGSPFVSVRVRVVGDGSNDATGTYATVLLTSFGLG